MNSLLKQLSLVYPNLNFKSDKVFSWSPKHQTITYKSAILASPHGEWSLLHEVGHALLEHTNYHTDYELLGLEMEAWEHAESIAKSQGIKIDKDHIQDCLDTYRDWIHSRSMCPSCFTNGLQDAKTGRYHCVNCLTTWKVPASLLCSRPARHINTVHQ